MPALGKKVGSVVICLTRKVMVQASSFQLELTIEIKADRGSNGISLRKQYHELAPAVLPFGRERVLWDHQPVGLFFIEANALVLGKVRGDHHDLTQYPGVSVLRYWLMLSI